MVSVPDYYRQLGIAPGASTRAIRSAYRRCLLRYHPDTNDGRRTDESKLHLVLEAGRILGNPELRAAYDQRILSPRNAAACAVKTAQTSLPLNLTESLKQLGASIFRRWAVLHARFFTAEKAAQLHHLHRKQSRQNPLEFSDCLTTAMRREQTSGYKFHADGIWRRKSSGVKAKPMATLHKRVRLWLLLMFILNLWWE